MSLFQFRSVVAVDKSASGGIRTHEAYAEGLKSSPFDHSGTLAVLTSFFDTIKICFFFCFFVAARNFLSCSVRGSNPRLAAHKTATLPTELTELMLMVKP